MAEWKYLYTLGREEPNSGTFTFTPVPAQANYSSWEVGALRISPSRYSDGQRQVTGREQVNVCFLQKHKNHGQGGPWFCIKTRDSAALVIYTKSSIS